MYAPDGRAASAFVVRPVTLVGMSTPDSGSRAFALVHADDPTAARAVLGALPSAFEQHGLELGVGSLTGASGLEPVPAPDRPAALVVMGSPAAAYDDTVPWLAAELDYLAAAVRAGVPVLGICFGGQALARVLGGRVALAEQGEHGFVTVRTRRPDLVPPGPWMQFHQDAFTLPPGATELARTDRALQAFSHGASLGLQFHPEITPAAFSAWSAGWDAGTLAEFARLGVDPDAIAAQIRQRAAESSRRCAALVGAFLTRARTASISSVSSVSSVSSASAG